MSYLLNTTPGGNYTNYIIDIPLMTLIPMIIDGISNSISNISYYRRI